MYFDLVFCILLQSLILEFADLFWIVLALALFRVSFSAAHVTFCQAGRRKSGGGYGRLLRFTVRWLMSQ